jgi:hypothetical protein
LYHSPQGKVYYEERKRMQQQVKQAMDTLEPASLPGLLFLAANISQHSTEVSAMMSALVNGSEQLRPEQQAQLLLQVTPQLLQQLLECAAQSGTDDVAGELCRVPGVAAALPGTTTTEKHVALPHHA